MKPDELRTLSRSARLLAGQFRDRPSRLEAMLASVPVNPADPHLNLAAFHRSLADIGADCRRLASETEADADVLTRSADEGELADRLSATFNRFVDVGGRIDGHPLWSESDRLLDYWSIADTSPQIVQLVSPLARDDVTLSKRAAAGARALPDTLRSTSSLWTGVSMQWRFDALQARVTSSFRALRAVGPASRFGRSHPELAAAGRRLVDGFGRATTMAANSTWGPATRLSAAQRSLSYQLSSAGRSGQRLAATTVARFSARFPTVAPRLGLARKIGGRALGVFGAGLDAASGYQSWQDGDRQAAAASGLKAAGGLILAFPPTPLTLALGGGLLAAGYVVEYWGDDIVRAGAKAVDYAERQIDQAKQRVADRAEAVGDTARSVVLEAGKTVDAVKELFRW